MSPLGTYVAFLWNRLDGPRGAVVAMAIIAGLSSGLGIAAVNAGIETWATGVVPWGALGLFVLSQALWVLTAYYAQFQAARMVAGLMYGMRNAASRRVANASLRAVEDQSHGRILAMLQHDTKAIGESVFASIIALRSIVLVLFAMVYLTQLSWVVAVLAILSVAMGVAAYIFQQSRMKGFMTKARATEAEYFDAVDDLLRGGKEARFFNAGQEAHLRRIDRLGVLGRNLTARWEFLGFTGRSIAHVALMVALGLLAFLPPQAISATGVPVFQAVTVMLYLVSGIELIVDAAHPITMGRVAHREYARIWDALPPETPTAELAEIRRGPVALQARGMTYTHAGSEGRFTLGPIDLDLSAPELVFITGGNGSGKTTLLKCLTGLYTPDGGELRFRGARVEAQNAALLRWSVATVFHDYHLFERLYGHRLGEKRARIQALLERFELAHKVDLGPLGFTSTRLSTGQKKRLGLIAALLLDRPVLVLDEFGAEQDPEFRDRFYREILPELRDEGRLIIAVTHDDRYFGICDRRIHLDYGRVKTYQPDAVMASSVQEDGGEGPVQAAVGAEDRA